MKTQNYSSRMGKRIDAVVLHSTAGYLSGSVSWLCNPQSRASVHYVIGRGGEVVQLVDEDAAAWHVRREVPGLWNERSIGIELVDDRIGDKSWQTEAQYSALVELLAAVVARYGVPLDRQHFVMHRELDPGRRFDPVGWSGSDVQALISDIFIKLNPLPVIVPEVAIDTITPILYQEEDMSLSKEELAEAVAIGQAKAIGSKRLADLLAAGKKLPKFYKHGAAIFVGGREGEKNAYLVPNMQVFYALGGVDNQWTEY